MALSTQYDNYCERTDFSFWAEPINAMTNGWFVVAGVVAMMMLLRRPERWSEHLSLWLLAAIMIAIGVGSFLFHTFATHWAMLADIYPIYLFQIVFLWCYPRRALQLSIGMVLAFFVLYAAVTIASGHLPIELNGSEMYLPTIVTLAAFGLSYAIKQGFVDKLLLTAALVFALSLTMRTIDNAICTSWPIGTHFLWHTLNALVLLLCWLSLYRHDINTKVE
ncbi:hypothetical protein GCM10011369_14600 [Neiella marina]|uniref:Ceramidase n=1 Tax=Neiella marina TaxID=508461 RepID=A0A8J2XP45_9GAMM|nr:ceramidase domain-containing protein [Neiella marina]GGA73870.1 hypothetical protein GCM10011369_14600 [Neiella marina]